MNTLQSKSGIIRKNQMMKYTVIQLAVNSLLSRSVKMRILNFYEPIPYITKGILPNEKRAQE